MKRTFKVLMFVLVAGLALQAANHIGVHWGLCSVEGMTCTSLFAPHAIEARWQAADAMPAPIQGAAIELTATTALIRERCDDKGWTANLGARFAVHALEHPPRGRADPDISVASDGGCADVYVDVDDLGFAVSGKLQKLEVSKAACTVVTPVVLESRDLRGRESDELNVRLSASLDAGTVEACSALLPDSSIPVADWLDGAQLRVDARYGAALTGLFGGEAAQGGRPEAASAWLRDVMRAVAMSHTIAFDAPEMKGSLRLESVPALGGENSPELKFELILDPGALAALPDDAPAMLDDSGALSVSWRMDHETDSVTVNGRPVARERQRFRDEPGDLDCVPEGAPLLFVEMDDEGVVNDEHIDAVFSAVEQGKTGSGNVIAVVFVHGWQHSAAPGDDYVCSFSTLIAAVETMEQQASWAANRPARTVLGIYVGWPGKMYTDEAANVVTTFWNRLAVADRVGSRGALTRLIRGLTERLPRDGADRADRSNAVLVAGHSLGARAVFGAVRDDVIGGAMLPALVVLVNPAFSADIYRAVHEQRCTSRMPLLLFSSLKDQVTRLVYPAGQTLTYRVGADPPTVYPEHVFTAANYKEFVTHVLAVASGAREPPTADDPQTISRGFLRVPEGTDVYSDTEVEVYSPVDSGRPASADWRYTMRLDRVGPPCESGEALARVIAVDPSIVSNHGDIFTAAFMEYIVRAFNRSIGAPQ